MNTGLLANCWWQATAGQTQFLVVALSSALEQSPALFSVNGHRANCDSVYKSDSYAEGTRFEFRTEAECRVYYI